MTEIDSYTNFTVWNMNGGPLPSATREAITLAIESIIKETEERDGIRLLWAANHRPGDKNGTS